MFEFKKASRAKIPLKILFDGPAGSGKTYSALVLSRQLAESWDKVLVLDCENGSAALYSHLGDFLHCEFPPPYEPKRFIEAISTAKKMAPSVLIIDGFSREWEGEGGVLDIHTRLGGRFNDWAKVLPEHNRLVETILQAPFHVILTARTKTEWATDQNDAGRIVPKKIGLKTSQKDGIDYEVTINFRLDERHLATAVKDRTGLFDLVPFKIDESIGAKIQQWYNEGTERVDKDYIQHLLLNKDVEKLTALADSESLTSEQKKFLVSKIQQIKGESK